MSSTTAVPETLADVLTKADPDKLADALRKVDLGALLAPTKKTITLGTVNAAVPLSPPALCINTLRVSDVTGGTAAVGTRVVVDSGGVALVAAPGATGNANVPGVASLSDDGATLTFEGTVKAIVVSYIPRSAADVTGLFKRS
jgi:hypothetical protein